MDNPRACGHIRQAPSLFAIPKIVFIPPDTKDVATLIIDLTGFLNNNIGKIDSIILAGLFYRQCVIIHPFMDGNGRVIYLITTAILGKVDSAYLRFSVLKITTIRVSLTILKPLAF